MDCSYKYGNLACGGGIMDSAFKYAEAHKMETEEEYPYLAKTRIGKCEAEESKGVIEHLSGYKDVTKNSDKQLEAALD